MKIRNAAIVLTALSTMGLSGLAMAQQQYEQQNLWQMGSGQQGQSQWRGQQQFGQQNQQQGQWIMQTQQIQQQLQQGLRAYNNNLDDTAADIVQNAAQEIRQQAQQVVGLGSKRALRVAAQQVQELADKIRNNQLQSTQQYRETARQVLQQLNQVQQIQQQTLSIQFQGTDEPQVSQYQQQLSRAMQAYQDNNQQVTVSILRSVYNDIRLQAQQAQRHQIGNDQLLNRAATQTRQLAMKIQNNDLQSTEQFRQTASQILQHLDQARQVQMTYQQGQIGQQGQQQRQQRGQQRWYDQPQQQRQQFGQQPQQFGQQQGQFGQPGQQGYIDLDYGQYGDQSEQEWWQNEGQQQPQGGQWNQWFERKGEVEWETEDNLW